MAPHRECARSKQGYGRSQAAPRQRRSVSVMARCLSDGAERAIGFIVRSSREIESVGARISPTAQGQRPQPIDHDGVVVVVLEAAEEMAVRVERVNLAVPEIADEDVAAEPAKGE